jgi:hypothetical protein
MKDRECEEFERSGWTLNPRTKRKIAPTGRVAKKLRDACGFTNTPEKKKRAPLTRELCDAVRARPGINPLTGRGIKIGGPTYRVLFRSCATQTATRGESNSSRRLASASSKYSPSRSLARSAPKISLVSPRMCEDKGFMQQSSTCWFNSVLNALIMSEGIGDIIREKVEELPKSVLKGFELTGRKKESCPLQPGKSHVLKYAYRYFAGLDHLLTPTTKNRPLSAVDAVMASPELMSIRRTGTGGFFPQRATGAILGAFFKPKEVAITTWQNANHTVTRDTRIISFQFPKRNGRHIELRDALKKRTKPKTLSSGDIKFELSSAVATIAFERGTAHAVAFFKCGGRDWMYDSNLKKSVRIDWSDGLTKLAEKKMRAYYEKRYGPVRKITFSCEFFSRKNGWK